MQVEGGYILLYGIGRSIRVASDSSGDIFGILFHEGNLV
jgi:hypothetical protein